MFTTTTANLEKERKELLNYPSMEVQREEYEKEIERGINDRMVIMRDVVVCGFILLSSPRP